MPNRYTPVNAGPNYTWFETTASFCPFCLERWSPKETECPTCGCGEYGLECEHCGADLEYANPIEYKCSRYLRKPTMWEKKLLAQISRSIDYDIVAPIPTRGLRGLFDGESNA